jgi:hypothetical protein
MRDGLPGRLGGFRRGDEFQRVALEHRQVPLDAVGEEAVGDQGRDGDDETQLRCHEHLRDAARELPALPVPKTVIRANVFTMPTTVPRRPMSGAAVAITARRESRRSK